MQGSEPPSNTDPVVKTEDVKTAPSSGEVYFACAKLSAELAAVRAALAASQLELAASQLELAASQLALAASRAELDAAQLALTASQEKGSVVRTKANGIIKDANITLAELKRLSKQFFEQCRASNTALRQSLSTQIIKLLISTNRLSADDEHRFRKLLASDCTFARPFERARFLAVAQEIIQLSLNPHTLGVNQSSGRRTEELLRWSHAAIAGAGAGVPALGPVLAIAIATPQLAPQPVVQPQVAQGSSVFQPLLAAYNERLEDTTKASRYNDLLAAILKQLNVAVAQLAECGYATATEAIIVTLKTLQPGTKLRTANCLDGAGGLDAMLRAELAKLGIVIADTEAYDKLLKLMTAKLDSRLAIVESRIKSTSFSDVDYACREVRNTLRDTITEYAWKCIDGSIRQIYKEEISAAGHMKGAGAIRVPHMVAAILPEHRRNMPLTFAEIRQHNIAKTASMVAAAAVTTAAEQASLATEGPIVLDDDDSDTDEESMPRASCSSARRGHKRGPHSTLGLDSNGHVTLVSDSDSDDEDKYNCSTDAYETDVDEGPRKQRRM